MHMYLWKNAIKQRGKKWENGDLAYLEQKWNERLNL